METKKGYITREGLESFKLYNEITWGIRRRLDDVKLYADFARSYYRDRYNYFSALYDKAYEASPKEMHREGGLFTDKYFVPTDPRVREYGNELSRVNEESIYVDFSGMRKDNDYWKHDKLFDLASVQRNKLLRLHSGGTPNIFQATHRDRPSWNTFIGHRVRDLLGLEQPNDYSTAAYNWHKLAQEAKWERFKARGQKHRRLS